MLRYKVVVEHNPLGGLYFVFAACLLEEAYYLCHVYTLRVCFDKAARVIPGVRARPLAVPGLAAYHVLVLDKVYHGTKLPYGLFGFHVCGFSRLRYR